MFHFDSVYRQLAIGNWQLATGAEPNRSAGYILTSKTSQLANCQLANCCTIPVLISKKL